ncbi:double-strand break repair protein AddB [Amaricoccus solimangrovi]|uniref:Double-strand break repair protein AddB n=1 Tax=Amaricoccus solimangrovi TaxID=2589815 RepID=A0A501X0W3_9RHOB|nr:double-strand break repair protein AddB [Amaricoccus solimangrovi]TPE52736.1 double-strand break repair protein AddB [Amaricoccus solimangrovi]
MSFFPPSDGPRVFHLPPGVDFARALVAGLDARLAGQPPEAAARVEIWVNTQRMRRALLAELGRGPARLLPRIRVVTELGEDPLGPLDPAPPVSSLRRKLELARLVSALIAADPSLAAETAAYDLADSLADLFDEMRGEGVPPEALEAIDAGEHAEHWRRGLAFLRLLADYEAASGDVGGQGRLRAAAEAWAELWRLAPPAHPVIVAGSTGSRGATRRFMAHVARLPQGALILPGLDATLPGHVWDRLDPEAEGAVDHPQHGFRRLGREIGFDPGASEPWASIPPPAPERDALISLALRPAPVTDQWRSEGAALRPTLAAACADLTWIEAPDPRGEALAIALALREAAERERRAALITPDRTLARRVTAELERWGLIPDDSAGRPLALTPPGVLLRRIAARMGERLTPGALLTLLKHPLVNSGEGARGRHMELTAKLERGKLRGGAPWIDWADLGQWARAEGAEEWIGWLAAALDATPPEGPVPLAERVAWHVATAEALAGGPAGAGHRLWDRSAGLRARALMEDLSRDAEAGGPVTPVEYEALLRSIMAAVDVPEEAVVTHPGIAIWGTLEARVQTAELVILGGLNEGVWPSLPGADPWLNRAMRAELGLPSPERRIGLAAHDFQQAMGAGRVIVSRALRDAEAPTVAARWLTRLENLLRGLPPDGEAAVEAAKARGKALLAQAARLSRPETREEPARRPSPRLAPGQFPAELSVTQIETLARDPYAIYARKVLRLRRLDPPGREADALARGTALHAVVEKFILDTRDALPADARAALIDAAERGLEETTPWPAVRAIWLARLARTAERFVDGEAERRLRAEPLAHEIRGRRAFEGLPAPFAVTAKADRIDRAPEGYVIYDYKSGGLPSDRTHLQLPLEAAIAEAGGFEKLPAAPAWHLELISIGTGDSRALGEVAERVEATWTRLAALIARYQSGEVGFTARLRPAQLVYANDYDHLARYGEWADGEEPEGMA